jgi:hypothetical protein
MKAQNWHNRPNGPRDLYRVFHPAQYTFFSAAHVTFSKIDHILGHKANLSQCKKVEITPCILPNHHAIKLELNTKRKYRIFSNVLTLNNTLLNGQ